jgi:DNA-binding CsgD family transcriptional regulator
MPLMSFFVYVLCLAAATAACWLAQRLVKIYRFRFLASYFGFLVGINILGLLNLVVNNLAAQVLGNLPDQSMRTIYILFGLIAFPFMAVIFYFLLDFVVGILDERFSPVFRAFYIALWVVLITAFLMRIQFALQGKRLPFLETLNAIAALVILTIPIAAFIYLTLRSAQRFHSQEKEGLRAFALVSLTCYVLYLLTFLIYGARTMAHLAVPACLFVASAAPVLVLNRFLARFSRPVLSDDFSGALADRFNREHRLSTREGEILALLLSGKSNKEIEKDLFISPNTVRNHVYNIYQKLKVSSRLQLMNRLRTWHDSGAGQPR